MFLQIVHSSIDPAKIDDVLALKDDVIAATKKQAGFVSFQGVSAEPQERSSPSAPGRPRLPGSFPCARSWATSSTGSPRSDFR